MRFKIVALLFLFLPLTLQAQQQYATTKTWGVLPLDSRMTTTNLWYSFPSGICNVPSMGYNNVPYCLANGTPTPTAANVVFYFDKTHQTWYQITALGSGWMDMAALNANNIYLLKATTICTNQGAGAYGIFHWDGSALTQPYPTSCALHIAVGGDGTLFDVAWSKKLYEILPGATSGVALDTSTGWSYVSGPDMNTVCGVKNGMIQMYSVGTGVFTQMPAQPPAAVSTYSCHVSDDPNDGLTLFAMYRTTNNHGQYINAVAKYNFTSNAWAYVVTPSAPIGLASISKWQTLMLDGSGRPYHFNVNGVSYTVTTSGTGPNCPGLNNCPSGVHHTQSLCVSLPGGLNSGCGTQSVAPTTNLNNQRYDVTATGCDALFGDPNACVPSDTGDVICSATGADLGGPGGSPSPLTLFSEYIGWWDGYFSPEAAVYTTFMGLPMISVPARVGDTENACRMGTYAVCTPPYGQDTIGQTGVCWGPGCTAGIAQNAALTKAKAHAPGKPIAWGTFYTYTDGDPNSCNLITYYDEQAGTVPCY